MVWYATWRHNNWFNLGQSSQKHYNWKIKVSVSSKSFDPNKMWNANLFFQVFFISVGHMLLIKSRLSLKCSSVWIESRNTQIWLFYGLVCWVFLTTAAVKMLFLTANFFWIFDCNFVLTLGKEKKRTLPL
jgi:hypothetical protein